ncbi:ribonuclease E/G [Clostridium sp. P21]|uniref:Ribonuclease E/G n=1 Tax=Clostridium muellerianum TaxID=2716538 RepID=A0A7Y0HQV5_9CLOT|nr:ribonuclease E/G [Clostridium muellerianum]NMM64546.1 ribonuclease E/G [Clostridium muellerianum]
MKDIFIERQDNLLRIAIKQNNILKECFIEEENGEPYPGEIYKGVVKNVVPAIKCAFIDIGHKKNVYIYLDNKFKNTKLKKGQELLVQVLKEDLGNKGAKVTNVISIPGKYCVLMTMNDELTFSRKIEDESLKESIRKQLERPDDVGIMVRTEGANASVSLINEEIAKLYSIYNNIKNNARYFNKVGLLFDNGGILGRVLRDKLNSNNCKIYVNTEEDYNYISGFLMDSLYGKISLKLYEENRTLFDYYGIEREILSLRNNRVYLNCGGYIVIDRTEAMYVIDVNSGKNVKGTSIGKTAYITNFQAAEEIARQVELRNLSGIIVIDFIDMDNEENRKKIMNKLHEGFKDDKNKTVIYPFTELNLVQIARKRSGKSIYDYIEESCSACGGRGKRIRFSHICMLIRNEILKIEEQRDIKDIHIEIDENYSDDIKGDVITFVKNINALDKSVYVTYVKDEHFKVEPLIFANQIENLEMFKIYE